MEGQKSANELAQETGTSHHRSDMQYQLAQIDPHSCDPVHGQVRL